MFSCFSMLSNDYFKDNILFGLPYVEERYQKTLEVRSLSH